MILRSDSTSPTMWEKGKEKGREGLVFAWPGRSSPVEA